MGDNHCTAASPLLTLHSEHTFSSSTIALSSLGEVLDGSRKRNEVCLRIHIISVAQLPSPARTSTSAPAEWVAWAAMLGVGDVPR